MFNFDSKMKKINQSKLTDLTHLNLYKAAFCPAQDGAQLLIPIHVHVLAFKLKKTNPKHLKFVRLAFCQLATKRHH